MMDVLMLII